MKGARKALVIALVLGCAGCDWLFRRNHDAPDAGSFDPPRVTVTPMIVPPEGGLSPAALASALAHASEEDDEEPDASAPDGGLACPLPIHPAYCRRSCRNYISRSFSMHARRIASPLRAGVGTCGPYKVFAEDQGGIDGGPAGGLIEYFDSATNELVGAADTRSKSSCGTYGTIPKCKPVIAWGPPYGSRK